MRTKSRARTGYIAAVIGAVAGTATGMALAYFPLLLYENATVPEDSHGVNAAVFIFLGIPMLWVGAAVGCWLALRLRHHTEAQSTAYQVAWLVPLVVLLPAALMLQFDLLGAAYLAYPVIGVVAAALLASFLVLRR